MQIAVTLLILILAGCSAVSPGRSPTIVESNSPAIGQSGALEESVGLETVGGMLTPLLHVGCKIPCESKEVFSTAEDDQQEIRIRLYRGNAALAADATPLGEYRIEGIPPMPRGRPQIEVRLATENGDVVIEAIEVGTRRPYPVARVESSR